jgi:hypothetical protein
LQQAQEDRISSAGNVKPISASSKRFLRLQKSNIESERQLAWEAPAAKRAANGGSEAQIL